MYLKEYFARIDVIDSANENKKLTTKELKRNRRMQEDLQDKWDETVEDFSIFTNNPKNQRRAGYVLSAVAAVLLIKSLVDRDSLSEYTWGTCGLLAFAIAVLGTVVFLWPHRKYNIDPSLLYSSPRCEDEDMKPRIAPYRVDLSNLNLWIPNDFGCTMFCYCNPLVVLMMLVTTPLSEGFKMQALVALGTTIMIRVLVALYDKRMRYQKIVLEAVYETLNRQLNMRHTSTFSSFSQASS